MNSVQLAEGSRLPADCLTTTPSGHVGRTPHALLFLKAQNSCGREQTCLNYWKPIQGPDTGWNVHAPKTAMLCAMQIDNANCWQTEDDIYSLILSQTIVFIVQTPT